MGSIDEVREAGSELPAASAETRWLSTPLYLCRIDHHHLGNSDADFLRQSRDLAAAVRRFCRETCSPTTRRAAMCHAISCFEREECRKRPAAGRWIPIRFLKALNDRWTERQATIQHLVLRAGPRVCISLPASSESVINLTSRAIIRAVACRICPV
jgi:hypothetical protein